MTFHPLTAPIGARATEVLSADNARPDRFTLMDTVRQARTALGLNAPVIATLDALLSCLPPKRNHDFVFASNATLAFRRNGISERTLRRHIAQLVEVGFLIRSDSPNRKRFTKHDSATGRVMRFGFDLSPLFAAFAQIAAQARACNERAAHLAYLRSKLRAAIAITLEAHPLNADAELAQRALRRNLDPAEIETFLEKLAPVREFEVSDQAEPLETKAKMSGSDGQNDRHHQNSKKEHLDSKDQPVTLAMLADACPEATSYLETQPQSANDVIDHARRLAPMMGIDRSSYQLAEERLGALGAAVSVWGLMQMQGKIRQIGAYFRSLTSGKRSTGFDPWALVHRLIRQKQWASC